MLKSLAQCPHCDFKMLFENSEEKLFRCQNPDCLCVTCRFCKEENHLPLRCSEVEKKSDANSRHAVEEAMTNARVRSCKCGQRYYKTEGCNKMTCTSCGGLSCYVCRADIPKKTDYGHFCQHPRNPGQGCPSNCGKCNLFSNSEEDDALAVKDAGLAAAKSGKRPADQMDGDGNVDLTGDDGGEGMLAVLAEAEKDADAAMRKKQRAAGGPAVMPAPGLPGMAPLPAMDYQAAIRQAQAMMARHTVAPPRARGRAQGGARRGGRR